MTMPKEKGKKADKGLWDAVSDTVRALGKAHSNIKQKCSNEKDPQFKTYGGRGIAFHPAWAADRKRFIKEVMEEIGPKRTRFDSLDRKDNGRHYEPGNLRWASKQEQAINRRSSAKVLFKGMEVYRAEIARELGLRPDTVGKQLRNDPRANPRAVKFEHYWLQRLKENGRFPMAFTHKQWRLVADMLNRLRAEVNLAPAVRYSIQFWEDFAEEAAEAGGLRIYPKQPNVEFFVAHIETAVSFGNAKLAKLEAARARQIQAQLEREADARQEALEAEAMERQANAWIERHRQRGEVSTGLSFLQSIAAGQSGFTPEGRVSEGHIAVPQQAPSLRPPVNSRREDRLEPSPNSTGRRSYERPAYSSWDEDEAFAGASPPEIEEIEPIDEPSEAENCN